MVILNLQKLDGLDGFSMIARSGQWSQEMIFLDQCGFQHLPGAVVAALGPVWGLPMNSTN